MNWKVWEPGSAAVAALTAMLAKVGVASVNSNPATAIRTAVILLFPVALAWTTVEGLGVSVLAPRIWLSLVLSGMATGLSWLRYSRALQSGKASQFAPVDQLREVFVLMPSAAFLGGKLSWHQRPGGALILACAVVIALKPA